MSLGAILTPKVWFMAKPKKIDDQAIAFTLCEKQIEALDRTKYLSVILEEHLSKSTCRTNPSTCIKVFNHSDDYVMMINHDDDYDGPGTINQNLHIPKTLELKNVEIL